MNAPTLGGIAIAFVVLAVVSRLMDWRRPKARRVPLWRPGLVTDLSYWTVLPFVNHYLVGGVALLALAVFALITYGRIDQAQILAGFGPLSRLPIAVQAILMLLLSDFIGYWMHRGFHGRRLWPIHAIHHSSRSLDWLSATRVHPIGEIIGRLAIMLPLLAMGFAPMAVAWVAPVIGVFGLLLHANLDWDWGPLRTVIASPRFHRWHHTSEADALDKNFAGLFPVWDIVFGTYFMPRDRVPERFGTDTPVPDGLFAQMMFPFRRG
jgi:sterol desaturase/sphingolipid hydroxylase (fatty acid hydroxylase superfamily)